MLFDPLILNYCTAQSKIPWGHCWFGDDAAKADPRGGFDTEEEFLDHVKSFDILPVILFILHPGQTPRLSSTPFHPHFSLVFASTGRRLVSWLN